MAGSSGFKGSPDSISFLNDGDTGSFRLNYVITRVED